MTLKKILMTADAVGGVWNYSLQLAEALASHDIKVDLATMGPAPSPSQKQEAKAIANVSLYESTYRLEWMADPWDDIARAGEWLLGLERQLQPDVVHLNGYTQAALPWARPVCTVAHSCVLSWWDAVHQRPVPDSWSRYRAAVAEGIRLSDHVIAPSFTMLKMLRDIYGSLPASSVIYNGTSLRRFGPADKQPIVFAAGRLWDKAKNIDAIIQCAHELRWQFVIAGDGAPNLMTPENVSLIGKVSPQTVAHYMAIASIYCLPARYEPFGLSVLEAALSGCALVLGDIGSLRELWNGAAVLIAPDDRLRLKQRLSELMEDEGKRKRLAQLARQRAKQFTTERMALSYLEVYERLRQTGRAGSSIENI